MERNGFLIFRANNTALLRIPVRACPDPAGVRAMFEEWLDRDVQWEVAK